MSFTDVKSKPKLGIEIDTNDQDDINVVDVPPRQISQSFGSLPKSSSKEPGSN